MEFTSGMHCMWSINSSSTGQSTSIGDGWQGAKCVLGSGEKCSSRCISRASSLPEGLSSDAEGGRSGRWQTGEQKVVHRGEGWMPDAGRRGEEKRERGLFCYCTQEGMQRPLSGAAPPRRPSHLIPQIVDWYCRHNRPQKEGKLPSPLPKL